MGYIGTEQKGSCRNWHFPGPLLLRGSLPVCSCMRMGHPKAPKRFLESSKVKKATIAVGLSFLALGFACPRASATKFKGYFAPAVLVSPLRDDIVYTPVGRGRITSKAGFRTHPVTGRKGSFHSGVDLAANLNDKVYNLIDGIVTRVGYRGALGVAVEVYHPYPNVRTICGHLND